MSQDTNRKIMGIVLMTAGFLGLVIYLGLLDL